ncbi:Calcineurin-like phosphoesterase [Dyadobacter sp. SG02]|uniref:metallophosphoesterase family protein n=1 Tax=Dyadobacter sp. SG02 TaxID=1855291 RepID=UPI0008AC063E|nr:metallophosphoesterase [Dyadobacter sp. SG02]SEJ00788.1 Calcineurin-like phosphoesterase [Dyadobacter sp. SG02]
MKSDFFKKFSKPVFKRDVPDDSFKYLPAPEPSGKYPYHLDLEAIDPVPDQHKLAFHMVGDTGSIRTPDFQKLVVGEMVKQFEAAEKTGYEPQFLFHLGDVVYNHGEASQYQRQFFEPYQKYPGPIFAIPGNHDSDINPDSPVRYNSLDAFKAVFCDTERRTVSFSGNAARKSMVQPNVYWTLLTPLANMIGLYSNVTKFGAVTDEQRKWLINELKRADSERPEKAVILCLHHSPYSADINHGSSMPMIELLEGVFEETGIYPDIVFSGHVHNYQRFGRHYGHNGRVLPFIVAGSGGYDELHPVAYTNDYRFDSNLPEFEGINLEHSCDTKHGFLKVLLERTSGGITITVEFYTLPHERRVEAGVNAALEDRLVLKI